MKVRTAVLWWLVNGRDHYSLKEKDRAVKSLMPLVSTLFPGINYYSVTGFSQVVFECVIPVLSKQYPELLTIPAEKVKPKATIEIATVLSSKGYEWEGLRWKSRLQKLLVAA